MIFNEGLNGQSLPKGFTQGQLDSLDHCGIVNPRVGKSHGLVDPSPFGSDEFNRQREEVKEVVSLVKQGVMPVDFLYDYHPRDDFDPEHVPDALQMAGIKTPMDCALAVEMDNPMDLGFFISAELRRMGVPRKQETTPHVPFIENIFDINVALAVYTKIAIEKCFDEKYLHMAVRPGLNRTDADWLIYPNPKHGRFPAGHGGAAGATHLVMTRNYQVDEQIEKLIYDCCYCFAQWRTFSGMHMAEDNLAGLEIMRSMPTGMSGEFQYIAS